MGRKKSIAAVEWAISNNNALFLTAQQDIDTEDPTFKDLSHYGVVAEVKQVLRVRALRHMYAEPKAGIGLSATRGYV